MIIVLTYFLDGSAIPELAFFDMEQDVSAMGAYIAAQASELKKVLIYEQPTPEDMPYQIYPLVSEAE